MSENEFSRTHNKALAPKLRCSTQELWICAMRVVRESALTVVPAETGHAPSLLCIAAEETILLPLRPVVVVGYVDQQAAYDFFVFGSGIEIDRLVQVV